MNILVLGAGGFIGSHLVKKLKEEGHWVRGVDRKYPEFSKTLADDFVIANLCDPYVYRPIFDRHFDEVYTMAAEMGGAGYIFTGEHDAIVMHNSALINLNVAEFCRKCKVGKVFFSSSACIYPQENQQDTDNPNCKEDSAYPANPDSPYGWEKLFSETLYLSYMRNYGLEVRISRYHNILGNESSWKGGREKAPAAICRKVAEAEDGGFIEIWGDGKTTRSFLYIDECLTGTLLLMRNSNGFTGPVNIGSEEMVTIEELTKKIINISGKSLSIKYIPGPQGVRGRNSHNELIFSKLGWKPSLPLDYGLKITYEWIAEQVKKDKISNAK